MEEKVEVLVNLHQHVYAQNVDMKHQKSWENHAETPNVQNVALRYMVLEDVLIKLKINKKINNLCYNFINIKNNIKK